MPLPSPAAVPVGSFYTSIVEIDRCGRKGIVECGEFHFFFGVFFCPDGISLKSRYQVDGDEVGCACLMLGDILLFAILIPSAFGGYRFAKSEEYVAFERNYNKKNEKK